METGDAGAAGVPSAVIWLAVLAGAAVVLAGPAHRSGSRERPARGSTPPVRRPSGFSADRAARVGLAVTSADGAAVRRRPGVSVARVPRLRSG